MNLAHVRILVTDFDRSFRFYRDSLGLRAEEGDLGGVYASFATGDAQISLFRRELMAAALGAAELPVGGGVVAQDRLLLSVAVESLDASFEELRRRGVSFLNEPHPEPGWGIRVVHLRDPDGTLIELYETLPVADWTPELRDAMGV